MLNQFHRDPHIQISSKFDTYQTTTGVLHITGLHLSEYANPVLIVILPFQGTHRHNAAVYCLMFQNIFDIFFKNSLICFHWNWEQSSRTHSLRNQRTNFVNSLICCSLGLIKHRTGAYCSLCTLLLNPVVQKTNPLIWQYSLYPCSFLLGNRTLKTNVHSTTPHSIDFRLNFRL